MISKKELTELDFHDIIQYYDYIIESYLNGQFEQSIELYGDLSVGQQYDFSDYIVMEDTCENMEYTPMEFIRFLSK